MSGKLIVFPPVSEAKSKKASRKNPLVQLTMPAVSSFLKDTRGLVTWKAADMAKTLGVSLRQANDAIPLLGMQGYIKAAAKDEWMTTIAGEQLSGSTPPHFQKAAVERALTALEERIRELRENQDSPFTITTALAFGEFLGNASRVQAADVGIELKPRNGGKRSNRKVAGVPAEPNSALGGRRARQALFATLRARSPVFHLVPYSEWMSARTHRKLF